MNALVYINFGLIIIILTFCKSAEREDLTRVKPSKEITSYSILKFAIECYGTNPTIEELMLYYGLKNKEYIALLKNRKDYQPEPIDLEEIRKNMVANNPSNPFIKYDFLNPWKKPPSPPRGGQNRARTFWNNPNGYRYSAPINVKPGHLF